MGYGKRAGSEGLRKSGWEATMLIRYTKRDTMHFYKTGLITQKFLYGIPARTSLSPLLAQDSPEPTSL